MGITYGDVNKLSDAELIDYLSGSSFIVDVSSYIKEVRTDAAKIMNRTPKIDAETGFDLHEDPDTDSIYRLIISFCKDNDLLLPNILFTDKTSDIKVLDFSLVVPNGTDNEFICKAIKENQDNEKWEMLRKSDNVILFLFDTVRNICDELSIGIPHIYVIPGIMNGYVTPNSDTIHIKTQAISRGRCFLIWTITHELRHKWQIKYNRYDLSDYFYLSDRDIDIRTGRYDVEREQAYLMQPTELDANGFAYYYTHKVGFTDDEINKALMLTVQYSTVADAIKSYNPNVDR